MRTNALLALAASLLLAATATAQVTQQGSTRIRAAIVPFTNSTGNQALDAVAAQLTDATLAAARQVPRADLMRITPRPGTGDVSLSAVATRTGAELVVRGTLAVEGNELVIRPTVVDTKTGKTVHQLRAERAPLDDPDRAVARVANRIAGMLALHNDPKSLRPELYTVPTIQGYLQQQRADRLFITRPLAALAVIDSIVRDDSSNVYPLAQAVAIYGNAGRVAERDSLLRIVERLQDRLTPLERQFIPWYAEPPAKSYQAARDAYRMDPTSSLWAYAMALSANQAGYYAEAVRPLSRRAEFTARGDSSTRNWPPYRTQYMQALHATGDYTRELAEVKRARTELPNADEFTAYAQELRALAALGRIDEMRAVVARLMTRRPDSVPVIPIATAALELERHGHKREGDQMIAELAEFARSHEAAMDSLTYATSLALAHDYDAALPRLERLASGSDNSVRIGRYAVFSVFAGHREVGEQTIARFAAMGDNANAHLWQGLITAAMGNCDGAVAHFRMAVAKGQVYGASSFWHWDPATEPIWSCAAYKQLVPMHAP